MDQSFFVIKFAEAKQPEYREKKGQGYLEFGERNDYPNYLLDLYAKSAKNNAIIGGKVKYITGKGWDTEDIAGNQFIKSPNPYESLLSITKKIATDIEIFGGAYLQIVWSEFGGKLAEIYHVDFSSIRTNKDNTQFWYKCDWADRKEEAKIYAAFNPSTGTGSQIMYIKEYRPGQKAYALPSYLGSLNYIEADIEVSKHVLGNAQTGFSPSKLITLPNGEPNDTKKREITRQFEDRFTGADGKKFILSFVNDSSRKPIIDDLGASDLTNEDFGRVDTMIQQNIFAGHQITSPSLFGIAEPGKLGSRNEIRDAYEIFKNTYIGDKQQQLEEVINTLAQLRGAVEELKIIPVEPIAYELSEATIVANMDKNEIREKAGLHSVEMPQAPAVQVVLSAINSLSPIVAAKVLEAMSADEIRSLAALQPTAQKLTFSDDEVIGMFEEIAQKKSEYSILGSGELTQLDLQFADQQLSTLELSILDLINKDKRISAETIAEVLKVDQRIVETLMRNFIDTGIVSENKNKERKVTKPLSELTDGRTPVTKTIAVMYSYEWKPSIPSYQRDTADHPSRAFCRRLMAVDGLYKRSDIEKLTARLGYSVFDRGGGWWGKSTSCRHEWRSNIVVKNEVK